jgi:hypothetical protein
MAVACLRAWFGGFRVGSTSLGFGFYDRRRPELLNQAVLPLVWTRPSEPRPGTGSNSKSRDCHDLPGRAASALA